ncbi:MAG: FecR domain-containing protein [Phormidesmis sp.]
MKPLRLKPLRLSLISGLLGVGLALSNLAPAQAQATITSADVYTLQNSVTLNQQPAAVGDRMVPQDTLRTGARSRAELLFNEGSLVRTGAGTTFRFPAGQRSFELINGSTLLMIRPGLGASRITTPEAVITALGTALFVQHDPASNTSIVGVLTESPAGPVTVTDANSNVSVQLSAGQVVSVANGVVGFIEYFILPAFYDTVDLAAGLAPGQEAFVGQQSAAVQETLNAVRAESIGPFNSQVAWLGGLCQQGAQVLEQTTQQTPLSPLTSLFDQLLSGARLPETLLPGQIAAVPGADLVVTPLRSLNGAAWLGDYCYTQRQFEEGRSPAPAQPPWAQPNKHVPASNPSDKLFSVSR